MRNRLVIVVLALTLTSPWHRVLRGDEAPAPKPLVAQEPVRLETTTGTLYGTLDLPRTSAPFPVVVILAGSGPTDRDGNQQGLKNDSLKLVGRALAERGIAALRYDRRGVGESRQACLNEVDLRFDMLVDDAAQWVGFLRKDPRFGKVGVIGHSEGALVGMLAAQRAPADAFVSLAGVARDSAAAIRRQLARNLSKELVTQSDPIIDALAAGRTVAEVPKDLTTLFRPSVQPYLISLFKYDPTREIAALKVPIMIVQGTTDLQVTLDDGKHLAASRTDARWLEIEGMNHVLKRARRPLEQNFAYTLPILPLAPGLADGLADFLGTALAQNRENAAPTLQAPKPTIPKLRVLVPAYFYPGGEGLAEWDKLIASPGRSAIIVIVNPASGPGRMADPNYVAVVKRARDAGLALIGYVSTSYGKRPLDDIKRDVDQWLQLYPGIHGTFFDEQASDAEHVATYGHYYDYAKSKGLDLVVSNPGTTCAEGYVSRPTTDVVCLFENRLAPDWFRLPAWTKRYPAARFAALPYKVATADQMRACVKEAVDNRIGVLYVTDTNAAMPWGRLPRYWNGELETVRTINESAPR